jgi:undecaprenyl-diphosphatase
VSVAGALNDNVRAVSRQFRRGRHRDGLPAWPPTRLAAALLLAFAAIIFLGWAADVAAVVWAYRLPNWFIEFGRLLSETGRSVWFLVAGGFLSLVFFLGDWRRVGTCARLAWWELGALAGYAFTAFASAGILVNILKPIFGRARPRLILENGPFAFDPLSFGYSAASFPSGHSTDMGVLIVVACLSFPKLRLAFVLAGVTFASSRVVVLAHYPSDVLAGLLLGASVAYAIARLYGRAGYAFRIGTDGRLHTRTSALRRLTRRSGGPLQIAAALPPAFLPGRRRAVATLPEPDPAPQRDRP